MEIIHNYRHNKALRDSFNALAEQTFGLNFENWYQLGHWGDCYDPYSVVIDGQVVANVSVNRTDLVIGGETKHLLQLGTVMTAEDFRSRGFSRAIMEHLEPMLTQADGVYLFGNDSVVDFYPKFGFVPGKELVYSRQFPKAGPCQMEKMDMADPEIRAKLERAMAESTFADGCHMVNNPGLIFFYAAQFLNDCVYYWAERDVWVIAEEDEGVWTLHNVFTRSDVTAGQVIESFGADGTWTLGFAPADPENWECQELLEDDCHFFVRGSVFGEFEKLGLRIPSLSHA